MRVTVLLALVATPLAAEGPMAAVFPTDASCYLRYYDDAHLAKHPEQMVREIVLGPDQQFFGQMPLPVELAVTLRNGQRYEASAYCEADGNALSCGLEGDAGWMMITPRKGKILIAVGRSGLSFEGDDGFMELSGTAGDDREFLLPAVPADSCP